jgi:hypothetical protein
MIVCDRAIEKCYARLLDETIRAEALASSCATRNRRSYEGSAVALPS